MTEIMKDEVTPAVRETMAQVRDIVRSAKFLVFFGGAGVSTDSGIPDFRGTNGLYTKGAEAFTDPPEYLLSADCLENEPEKFYAYYRSQMIYPDAVPNAAHLALAELEKQNILKALITQNIDGLHAAAGNQHIFELHGSTARNYCAACYRRYPVTDVTQSSGVPRCKCGGMIRPDVVLYGEGLDGEVFSNAAERVGRADVLLVAGSSLTVQPAASLVGCFPGKHLIIVNYTPTPYDGMAEYVLHLPLSKVLDYLAQENPQDFC